MTKTEQRLLLALAVVLAACSPTRPTGAPFVKPSELIGSWTGVPGVTLIGDGRQLAGISQGVPLQLTDDGRFQLGTCRGRWDYLARTPDGFTFSQHGCAAPELWTLYTANVPRAANAIEVVGGSREYPIEKQRQTSVGNAPWGRRLIVMLCCGGIWFWSVGYGVHLRERPTGRRLSALVCIGGWSVLFGGQLLWISTVFQWSWDWPL